VRRTFDWGVLDEKGTHPNTNIERPKWDFGLPVSYCVIIVSVPVDYVETKFVLKVKLLSVPKRTRAKYLQKAQFCFPHVEFIPDCFGTVTGHPDVRYMRTTFRHIAQPTLADVKNLYHEIADNCTDKTI
jgi:hypothetical protein